ncbi:MAG: SpoIIE family protein phosphatase [Carbonactinosporaceae bacterium]
MRTVTIAITAQTRATFEPTGRSAAAARRFVHRTLMEWGITDFVDDAVLLVSELVTNAIVHAGTRTDVTCLRYDGGIHVEVQDRHPSRGLPQTLLPADTDREGGRGLYLSARLASAWGVDYTRTAKRVWFRLEGEAAAPRESHGPGLSLLSRPAPLRIATVMVGSGGRVRLWNHEASTVFGWEATEVLGAPLDDLIVWPDGQTSIPFDRETAWHAEWQGEYAIRHREGGLVPVFASHVRSLTADDDTALTCLLVHASQRDALEKPPPEPPRPVHQAAAEEMPDDDWAGLTEPVAARLGLDDLLHRTVERARDALGGDAAYVLIATDDETEQEVRATIGLPVTVQRYVRVPLEGMAARVGSAGLPAVHDDLGERSTAVPLLGDTGMRALVSAPLRVEGRITGTLAVAAAQPGRFTNDDAMSLQRAADRIALAAESARLAELQRLRRGSLSFLAEASDLLAGTLDHDKTLALVAQLVVPRLAHWCAVHIVGELGAERLAYVWHADEARIDTLRALLDKAPQPLQSPVPGARRWTGLLEVPADAGQDKADIRQDEVITLPLVARGNAIGTLILGRPAGERFRREVLDLAQDLSRRAALALDNARLYSERVATSQALQRSLLPPDLPRIPSLDVGVVYQAAGAGNDVGGDFYDLFTIGEARWGFAIGDVCGTGAEAASVTGLARHALRILATEGLAVPDVLCRLNAAILDEGDRARFLTLIYGELAPRPAGGVRLTMASAGHPLPYRLDASGGVRTAARPQPLLGVIDDLELRAETVDLERGDVLVCVTDGVTERRNGNRMLDDEGLVEILSGCHGLSAPAVAARVQRAVADFAPEDPRDDMAVLVMRAV